MKKESYSFEDLGDYIDCGNNLAFGDDIQLFAQEHGWDGRLITHNEFWSQRMGAGPDAPTWQDYHHAYQEATAYMNENFLPQIAGQPNGGSVPRVQPLASLSSRGLVQCLSFAQQRKLRLASHRDGRHRSPTVVRRRASQRMRYWRPCAAHVANGYPWGDQSFPKFLKPEGSRWRF